MNIRITDSWLREYIKTKATAKEIAHMLSLSGPSVERVLKKGNDFIYDIEVTTNRVDMMSVLGIARETNAILPQFNFPVKFNSPDFEKIDLSIETENELKVKILDPDRVCRRILGIVLEVDIKKSPDFIIERLENTGIRSKNILVDITNYVMTETGQPTHVFDYDRLKTKKLLLRKAKKGEKITAFDKKTYSLPGGDIVIDNGKGEIIDLPGIIGTDNSVVTSKTKRILFFIEANDAHAIRQSSMSLGIRTVAATINEKGADPINAKKALFRGIELYRKWANGKVASKIHDLYPNPYVPRKLEINHKRIGEVIGVYIDGKKCAAILNSLGIESIYNQNSDKINSIIPSSRANDILIPEDLIEEIARIYGYYKIPSYLPTGQLPEQNYQYAKNFDHENNIKKYLCDWGYSETYTYSMISEDDITMAKLKNLSHLEIENPLTVDWVYLRRSLIPSILTVISKNIKNFNEVKLFELSNIYIPNNNKLPSEKPVLIAGGIIKDKAFFKLKGLCEKLFEKLNIDKYSFLPAKKIEGYWSKKKTAQILVNGNIIGILGQITPEVSEKFTVSDEVYFLELDLELLISNIQTNKTYKPIPQFPPIIEDYSFVFSKDQQTGELVRGIKNTDNFILSVSIKDTYKTTITVRVVYQNPVKPLSTKDIEPIRKKIVNFVKDTYNAEFKGKL